MNQSESFFLQKWTWISYFNYKYWQSRYQSIQKAKQFQIGSDDVLVVQHLSAHYVDFDYNINEVIKNFSFNFKKNQIYCIIGNSGSGKTTLVTHFNGLMKSKKGNIYIGEHNKILFYQRKIRNFKKIRKQISMVFQSPEYQLFKETVLKDVSYGPKVLGIDKTKIIPQSVKQLLDIGMTPEFFNSNPFNLSGGQKRKVALAGIFAIDPEIIIFDEPTVGLDPYSEKEVINMILNLKQKGKTVIVISHNMNHVLEIADHILLLNGGHLVYDAASFDFFQNKKIMDDYQINVPKVIEAIDALSELDPKYQKLWDFYPRTSAQLATAIQALWTKE